MQRPQTMSSLAVALTLCLLALATTAGSLDFPTSRWVQTSPSSYDFVVPADQSDAFGVEGCDAIAPGSICAEFTDGITVQEACCVSPDVLSLNSPDNEDPSACIAAVRLIRNGQSIIW